ncbi:MAG: hypothetical protein H7Y11_05395, partial [Armatimonadetes bacterium]|nr:hypothetical protein [Anaerolineae bacterium]
AGFEVKKRLPVSFLRMPLLKQLVSSSVLAAADGVLQSTGLLYAPSVFVQATAQGESPDNTGMMTPDALFVCPESGTALHREGDVLVSRQSGLRYAIRDGIYDFKAPLD